MNSEGNCPFILTWPPSHSWDPSSQSLLFPIGLFQPLIWWQSWGSSVWDLSARPLPPTWHASLPPSGKPQQRKVRPLMGFSRVNRAVIHSSWVKMGRFTSCKTCGEMPSVENTKPQQGTVSPPHEDAPFRLVSFGKIWIFKYNVAFSIFKMFIHGLLQID